MNKDKATKLKDKPLNRGSLTGEESFIVNQNTFTSPDSTLTFFKVQTSTQDKTVTVINAGTTTNQVVFREEISLKQQLEAQLHHVSHIRDPVTGDLLRLQKRVPGIGFDAVYLYRPTTPAFDGQTPSTLEDDEDQELYLYARLKSMPEEGDNTQFSILSVVIGNDANTPVSGWGYQWKDLYQGIRVPQFEYHALVLDMQKNVIAKSYQDSNTHMPIFEVGPGVDADHAIFCCVPLLPDGSNILKYVGLAGKLVFNPLALLH
ncbi:expressed unknown protein [Seminavis robusta]|uniref:Uncharacterized protein n=1 Tax=Seminavis robusta TaxID=568900 RepID=A0A9N8EJ27_9STRA|nr:expressed unknown protein [Seminavis robusta]|eukprot:Sro1283_g259090.1 n/a (261) ;mRNA; f:8729-9511